MLGTLAPFSPSEKKLKNPPKLIPHLTPPRSTHSSIQVAGRSEATRDGRAAEEATGEVYTTKQEKHKAQRKNKNKNKNQQKPWVFNNSLYDFLFSFHLAPVRVRVRIRVRIRKVLADFPNSDPNPNTDTEQSKVDRPSVRPSTCRA